MTSIQKKYPEKVKNFDPNYEIKLDKNFFDCKKRRDIYFKYFLKPIKSTDEYLELVGSFNSKELAKYLFDFVITGKKTPISS